jgi:AraC-like DNA-binding protein
MRPPLKNEITVTHVATPDPIEIHRGFAVTHAHPKHWHDEYHFCAVTGGAGYTVYQGTAHFTPPGSMFALPPGEVHSNYATEGGCSYTNIYIPASKVERFASQISRSPDLITPIVMFDVLVNGQFLNLCRVLEQSQRHLCRDSAFLNFFETLIQFLVESPTEEPLKEPRAVRIARESLDQHYDVDVSLEQLSVLANLSPYHLNRTFRRHLGMPPHAYQLQRRIARAKAMLRENSSIAEVAHRTGFADQSHFTRHFKRMVGITPGQFVPERKNVQDAQFAAD